jgi:hypothetical protein
VVAKRCGQATAIREPKQAKTHETDRSEPLNRRKAVRTEIIGRNPNKRFPDSFFLTNYVTNFFKNKFIY